MLSWYCETVPVLLQPRWQTFPLMSIDANSTHTKVCTGSVFLPSSGWSCYQLCPILDSKYYVFTSKACAINEQSLLNIASA